MEDNGDNCPTCRHPDGIPPEHLDLMRANAANPDVRARFAANMVTEGTGFFRQATPVMLPPEQTSAMLRNGPAVVGMLAPGQPPVFNLPTRHENGAAFLRLSGWEGLPNVGPPQYLRQMRHPTKNIRDPATRAALERAGPLQLGVLGAYSEATPTCSTIFETDGLWELQKAGQEPTPAYPDKQFPDWIIRLIRKMHSGVKDGAKGDKNGFLLVGSSDDFSPEAKTKLKNGREDRVYCGGRVDYYAVINELPKSDGGTLEARAIWDWAYSKVEEDAIKRLGECTQQSCDANSTLTKCKIRRGGSIGKIEQSVNGAVVQKLGYVAIHYFCRCSEPDKNAGADGPVTGPKEQK
jgi:hypothetical protein